MPTIIHPLIKVNHNLSQIGRKHGAAKRAAVSRGKPISGIGYKKEGHYFLELVFLTSPQPILDIFCSEC